MFLYLKRLFTILLGYRVPYTGYILFQLPDGKRVFWDEQKPGVEYLMIVLLEGKLLEVTKHKTISDYPVFCKKFGKKAGHFPVNVDNDSPKSLYCKIS